MTGIFKLYRLPSTDKVVSNLLAFISMAQDGQAEILAMQ